MKKNRIFRLNQNVRFRKGADEGLLLHTKTDFVYEASNAILDFIILFDGKKDTASILMDTQKKFDLVSEEIDQLKMVINELAAEDILI